MKIRIKAFALILIGICACEQEVSAQLITTVTYQSGTAAARKLYSSSNKIAANLLTGGGASTPGDGAILQLGYYSLADVNNPFNGVFIPLTGFGSLNTLYSGYTIGDDFNEGAGNGSFFLTADFNTTNAATNNNLPASGVPLSLRFFNSTSLATATLFNSVSDVVDWKWISPANPPSTVFVSLNDTNLQWLGGAGTAFYTSQPFAAVPEPSSFVLGIMACAGLTLIYKCRRVA